MKSSFIGFDQNCCEQLKLHSKSYIFEIQQEFVSKEFCLLKDPTLRVSFLFYFASSLNNSTTNVYFHVVHIKVILFEIILHCNFCRVFLLSIFFGIGCIPFFYYWILESKSCPIGRPSFVIAFMVWVELLPGNKAEFPCLLSLPIVNCPPKDPQARYIFSL